MSHATSAFYHSWFSPLSFSTLVIENPVSLSFFPAIRRCYRPVNVEHMFIELEQGLSPHSHSVNK